MKLIAKNNTILLRPSVAPLSRLSLFYSGGETLETAEFGTVKNPAHFKAMYALSPYHRVKDGQTYPAVIVTTGANDPRVDAWMPSKFAARLQAATASENPILVRLSADSGHGMGTALSEKIAQQADVFAFLFDQLGMAEK